MKGKDGERLRCQFPSSQGFVQLVEQHHLQAHLARSSASTMFIVLGFMLCTPGISADDFLSRCDHRDEMLVWKHYYATMGNLYTIDVEAMFVFNEPIPIYSFLDRRHEPRPLKGKHTPLAPFLPVLCKESVQCAQGQLWSQGRHLMACSPEDALRRWALAFEDLAIAIPVTEPIASLIARGCWNSIGLLGHWNLPRSLFVGQDFPPDTLHEVSFNDRSEHWSVDITQSRVATLAERVRGWAPAILGSIDDEDEQSAVQLELADTLQWFENLTSSFAGPMQRLRHPSHVMIASVFLTFLLGSRKHLGEAIPLALKIALPGLDLQDLAKQTQVPRSTTLARASTYLDFAFIMYCREQWQQEPHFLYAWGDSSPQSGRDWLMTLHAYCPAASVIDVFEAVNLLARSHEDVCDHHEALEVDIDEFARLNKVVRALQHHKCLPVAMGAGKTHMEDKVACLLHTLALECPDRNALQKLLSSVVSWAADMGTEMQLPQFQVSNLNNLLPTWMHAETMGDNLHADDDAFEKPQSAQQTAEQADPNAIMPQCLIIPGLLHIVHNLSDDLHKRLEWWDEFWGSLKSVAELLAERHLRERFINQCVRGSAAAEYEADFKACQVAKLYEKRWQQVIIFGLLRQTWSLQKFMADTSSDDSQVANGVEKALSSPLFCHYIYMVHIVRGMITRSESWLESCACHPSQEMPLIKNKKARVVPRKRKRCESSRSFHVSSCPMKGKRSCELASGCLESLLESLVQLAFSDFADVPDAFLTQEARTILMKDFEFGKSFLVFGLTSKMAFWSSLPWKLCGIAHHFPSVARRCAKECIETYDSQSIANPLLQERHQHPLTVRLLTGPLRAALEDFAQGKAMSRELLFEVAKLKFIPCAERVVEGMHRDVKIASKHVSLGPTKVSLSVRLPEIKVLVEESPDLLPKITALFDQMRNLKQAASHLGILQHPDLLQLLVQNVTKTTTWWLHVQHIVHRCVLSEQFADFSAARRVRDKKRDHDKEVATRLHSNLALPVPRTFEGIFKRSICDHFRKLSESSLFFSLPALQDAREDVGYELVDFRVDQCANADQQRELSELSHEVPNSDLQEPAPPGHVVFRVLHGHPERWKLAPAPLALKPLFDKGSCVVTLHEIVHNNAGNPAISLGSQIVPQLLSGLETCSLDVLRRDLQVWKLSSVVNYALPCPGFPSS